MKRLFICMFFFVCAQSYEDCSVFPAYGFNYYEGQGESNLDYMDGVNSASVYIPTCKLAVVEGFGFFFPCRSIVSFGINFVDDDGLFASEIVITSHQYVNGVKCGSSQSGCTTGGVLNSNSGLGDLKGGNTSISNWGSRFAIKESAYMYGLNGAPLDSTTTCTLTFQNNNAFEHLNMNLWITVASLENCEYGAFSLYPNSQPPCVIKGCKSSDLIQCFSSYSDPCEQGVCPLCGGQGWLSSYHECVPGTDNVLNLGIGEIFSTYIPTCLLQATQSLCIILPCKSYVSFGFESNDQNVLAWLEELETREFPLYARSAQFRPTGTECEWNETLCGDSLKYVQTEFSKQSFTCADGTCSCSVVGNEVYCGFNTYAITKNGYTDIIPKIVTIDGVFELNEPEFYDVGFDTSLIEFKGQPTGFLYGLDGSPLSDSSMCSFSFTPSSWDQLGTSFNFSIWFTVGPLNSTADSVVGPFCPDGTVPYYPNDYEQPQCPSSGCRQFDLVGCGPADGCTADCSPSFAGISFNPSGDITTDDTVSISFWLVDGDNSPATVYITWGDGVVEDPVTISTSLKPGYYENIASNTYSSEGSYCVKICADDNQNDLLTCASTLVQLSESCSQKKRSQPGGYATTLRILPSKQSPPPPSGSTTIISSSEEEKLSIQTKQSAVFSQGASKTPLVAFYFFLLLIFLSIFPIPT